MPVVAGRHRGDEERAEELFRLEIDASANCCGRHCYVLRPTVS
jgi:hypothetical protein